MIHHAHSLLPFGIAGRTLEPVVHRVGDRIRNPPLGYQGAVQRDGYARADVEQGCDLVATLGHNICVLMRGHGAVVAAESLKEAVITAIYLKVNAEVQLQAMTIGTPRGLSDGGVERSRATELSPLALDRAW